MDVHHGAGQAPPRQPVQAVQPQVPPEVAAWHAEDAARRSAAAAKRLRDDGTGAAFGGGRPGAHYAGPPTRVATADPASLDEALWLSLDMCEPQTVVTAAVAAASAAIAAASDATFQKK